MDYLAAVFDMDGTILDTLEDLRDSLNHALEARGHRHDYRTEQVGSFFGSGAEVAVARALALEAGMPQEELLRLRSADDRFLKALRAEVGEVLAVFKDWYPAHCEIKTRPYPGIPALLHTLRAAGIRVAVVSNKLDSAVQPLCAAHFPGMVDAALGEREPEIRRKPAPDMTLEALRRLHVTHREAVYIGDSEIDLLTAANTGMDCIAVSWGFRSRAFLAQQGAERIADSTRELEQMVLGEKSV